MVKMIVEVDEKLKKDFKKKCIDAGITMRRVLSELIYKWTKRGGEK